MSVLKAAQIQNLAGNTILGSSGSVIQVVQTVKVDTFTTSGTAFVNITGFTCSITPTSATNKIMIDICMYCGENQDSFPAFQLLRNGVAISVANLISPGTATTFGYCNTGNDARDQYLITPVNYKLLDSPLTSNTLTYGLQVSPMRTASRTFFLNRSNTIGDANQMTCTSTLTLTEVAA